MQIARKYKRFARNPFYRTLKNKLNTMVAVNGIFDGQRVHLLDKPEVTKKHKVIITFVQEITDAEAMETAQKFAENNAFSFWLDPREDLYQEYAGKKKK